MNPKTRVLRRHPKAKLVKLEGEKVAYAVQEGDTVLCASANSPTDAWKQAATALDYPYSDPVSRWPGTPET